MRGSVGGGDDGGAAAATAVCGGTFAEPEGFEGLFDVLDGIWELGGDPGGRPHGDIAGAVRVELNGDS